MYRSAILALAFLLAFFAFNQNTQAIDVEYRDLTGDGQKDIYLSNDKIWLQINNGKNPNKPKNNIVSVFSAGGMIYGDNMIVRYEQEMRAGDVNEGTYSAYPDYEIKNAKITDQTVKDYVGAQYGYLLNLINWTTYEIASDKKLDVTYTVVIPEHSEYALLQTIIKNISSSIININNPPGWIHHDLGIAWIISPGIDRIYLNGNGVIKHSVWETYNCSKTRPYVVYNNTKYNRSLTSGQISPIPSYLFAGTTHEEGYIFMMPKLTLATGESKTYISMIAFHKGFEKEADQIYTDAVNNLELLNQAVAYFSGSSGEENKSEMAITKKSNIKNIDRDDKAKDVQVFLHDSTVLKGSIVSETETELKLETSFGVVTIEKIKIKEIKSESEQDASSQKKGPLNQFEYAGMFSEGLAPVYVDKKWGFVNKMGEIVIQPKFDNISGNREEPAFSEGLAAVKLDSKWGFVNSTGSMSIYPQFENAGRFSDGVAPIAVYVGNSLKWGFINKMGNIVCKPEYNSACSSSEGLSCIQNKELISKAVSRLRNNVSAQNIALNFWGYIDHIRQVDIVSPRYQNAGDFSQGLANVSQVGAWGYINSKGKEVIEMKYNYCGRFSKEGLAIVIIDDKWGFLNIRGEIIIEPRFEETLDFSEGLAAVKIDGKWGYINTNGSIIIKIQFQKASNFSQGMAAVKIEDKWGYINTKGDILIQHHFDEADNFSEGRAIVKIEKGYKFINMEGNLAW